MSPEYRPLPIPRLYRDYDLPEDWDDTPVSDLPLARVEAIAGAAGGQRPPKIGLFGFRRRNQEPIAINLGCGMAMCFFGCNASGKTYGKGSLIEMVVQQMNAINMLRGCPACVIDVHYHQSAAYPPEMLHSVFPNSREGEVDRLIERCRIEPQGLKDVVLLTLPDKVDEERKRHPHVMVQGLTFALADLGLDELKLLLGMGEDRRTLYGRQVELLLRQLIKTGRRLTWMRLIHGVQNFHFAPTVRERLLSRLELVAPWIDDRRSLRSLLRPGRLINLDVRDGWLTRESALTLIALALRVFGLHGDQRDPHKQIPIVVSIDEAQKVMRGRLVLGVVDALIRERRHLAASVLLFGQDPLCIPGELLGLMDVVGVYRTQGRGWLPYLSQHLCGFGKLSGEAARKLPVGTVALWAKDWLVVSDDEEMKEEIREEYEHLIVVEVRPRATLHGGQTIEPGLG